MGESWTMNEALEYKRKIRADRAYAAVEMGKSQHEQAPWEGEREEKKNR